MRKRLFWLLFFPFLGAALAIVYLFFFATLYYESRALVFVDPKFDRILQVENVTSVASDLDSLNSLEKAMTSDSMILRVIEKLNLREDRSFLPASLGDELDRGNEISDSKLLKEIRGKRVQCALIRPTRLLELTVYDTDPARAQLIASTFVQEFEDFLGEQKRGEAQTSGSALREQAALAYDRALEAEKELEEFRISNPGLTVEQDHNLFAARLSEVGEELNRVSGRVLDLKSKVDTLSRIDPESDPISVFKIGGFETTEHVSDLLTQRGEAQAQLAAVSSKYTRSHPNYREAEKRYQDVEVQLKQLALDLKASLSGDYNAAATNEKLLRERVTDLQKQLGTVKSASSQFRAIQQKVETEWRIHEALQQKIGETSIITEKSTSITTEMSAPIQAHKPSKPSKPLIAILGGFLGGLCSLGIIGVDFFRDTPFVSCRQLEKNLALNVLAETPASREDEDDRTALLTQMSSVLLAPQHRHSRVIHLTSVRPDPSANRMADALGYASAHYGNPTLVISMVPGDDIQNLVTLKPRRSDHQHLYTMALPTGFLLAPSQTWQVLASQCDHFSRIIIESTMLESRSQVPAMISSYADTTVLTVDARRDRRSEVTRTVERLRENSQGSLTVILES